MPSLSVLQDLLAEGGIVDCQCLIDPELCEVEKEYCNDWRFARDLPDDERFSEAARCANRAANKTQNLMAEAWHDQYNRSEKGYQEPERCQISCDGCKYHEYDIVVKAAGNPMATPEEIERGNSFSVQFLQRHGILLSELRCPEPTCDGNLCTLDENFNFRCRKRYWAKDKHKKWQYKQCPFHRSLTSNSFLHHSHISPRIFLLIVNLWLRNEYTEARAMVNLKVSSDTLNTWRTKLEDACIQWTQIDNHLIGGPGIFVEIDETLMCKDKTSANMRGRPSKQYWMFGAIERHGDHSRHAIVPLVDFDPPDKDGFADIRTERRDSVTLLGYIRKYIAKGSVVISDGWSGYNVLDHCPEYHHVVINHKRQYVDADAPWVHTNNIERLWKSVKELSLRPGMRPHRLRHYVARFTILSKGKMRMGRKTTPRFAMVKAWEEQKLHNFLHILATLHPPY